MDTILIDLKPNKSFIDYDFEKYQLSLEKLKTRCFNLDKGVTDIGLSDKQYSFQHFTAFGIHNQLFLDPWSKKHLYWINKNVEIEGISLKNASDLKAKLQTKVYLHVPQNDLQVNENLNPTLCFPSHNYLFLSDGKGHLYLLHTGDRGEDSLKWKILIKESIICKVDQEIGDTSYTHNELNLQPAIILHSINRIDESTGRTILECLSLSVQEQVVPHPNNHGEDKFSHPPAHKKAHLSKSKSDDHVPSDSNDDQDSLTSAMKNTEKHATHFVTVLQWDTFLNTEDGLNFTLEHRRILEGLSSPNYGAIEPGGQALHLLSDMPFKFVYDSKMPIKHAQTTSTNDTNSGKALKCGEPKHVDIDGKNSAEGDKGEVTYYWSQTQTDLTMKITLPDNVRKEHITFHLEPTRIKISLETGEWEDSPIVLLEGSFRNGHKAKVRESTWLLVDDGKALEVTLTKNILAGHDNFAHSWPNPPLAGPFPGQMDPDYYRSLLDRMDAFTEGDGLGQPRDDKLTANQIASEDNRPLTQPYNMQELEECDAYPQDTSLVGRYCGKSHTISHQASLSSNKYLFTCTNGDPKTCPAFSLRYDVHATIWQPTLIVDEGQNAWDEDNLEDLIEQPKGMKATLSPWINVGALNAFGYVLASKDSRKFIGTSPDPTFNYAAISDSTNHVFIYWHVEYDATSPGPKNVLRNRKSGKVVEKVSKQQVVTLGIDQNSNTNAPPVIIGMACLKDSIAVLTNASLYIIFLN